LVTIGANFLNLTWKDSCSVYRNLGEPIKSAYQLYDVTAKPPGGADDPENQTYVEVGILQNSSNVNHYMVVNRRCTSSETRDITMTFQTTSGNAYRITEVFTGATTTCYPAGATTLPYTFTLGPGQGKLLKLEDLGAFSGTITSNTTWSGTVCVNTNVTVNSNVTLTVSPGATVKFASAKSLTINGSLKAISNNSAQRITFTGATATSGFWNGLIINSGSSNIDTLRRCDVQYAVDGISIYYSGNTNNVTVDKCKIRNNSADGIFVSGNNYSSATAHPVISNNTISNNGSGMEIADYAKPTITGNRIENNGGSGIFADSNCNAIIQYNLVSGNADYGLWFVLSSSAAVHRNTVQSNLEHGIFCASNSNLLAYGADTTKGRNEITGNYSAGISASSCTPLFGYGSYGSNWIHDNTDNEAQQFGAGYQLWAQSCYWSGQEGQVSGTVFTSPVLSSQPSPVGWGRSTNDDPTLRIGTPPAIIATLIPEDIQYSIAASTIMAKTAATTAATINWTTDLRAAIALGLSTGDWSPAEELIAALHRELQEARVPNVDFALVNTYANDLAVAAFIRKMLALVLMENDLVAGKISDALTKLAAFTQNNFDNAAELLANAGVIHLYRRNDLTAAQNVLVQLQTMAKNGDAIAAELVEAFDVILPRYQRQQEIISQRGGLEKPMVASSQALTPPTTPALAQNYPNPFNPETTIRFHLHERQQVRLVIYDLAGHRVRILVDNDLAAGEQTLSWDGRDEQGRSIASGVYFYELVTGSQIERKKMTLIR
jgi:parallel beta-helix repeat protein